MHEPTVLMASSVTAPPGQDSPSNGVVVTLGGNGG
jgi:hypothetical protein